MRDLEGSIAAMRAVWRSGPSMHKFPDDVRRYEMLIERIKPAVVVETGLLFGESQRWFAARVPYVVTVESDAKAIEQYQLNCHGLGWPPRNAYTVLGDSRNVFDVVRGQVVQHGPALVVLDSDHSTDVVYAELELYSQLVAVGSCLVVEDTLLHYLPRGGFLEGNWFNGDPLLAVEEWLPSNPEFVPDEEIEDAFPTTCAPGGWLRRVR